MKTHDIRDEIRAALGAHGAWRLRLKTAVKMGHTDIEPSQLRPDNLCQFGRWLEALPPEVQEAHHNTVHRARMLHREFHRTAAQVAQHIHDGELGVAQRMVDTGGTFENQSDALTRLLTDWCCQARVRMQRR